MNKCLISVPIGGTNIHLQMGKVHNLSGFW